MDSKQDVVRVGAWMTLTPKTIEPHQTVGQALEVMQQGRFRHLPVCVGGRVVGVLSQRDLDYTMALHSKTPSPNGGSLTKLLEVMSPEPQMVKEDQSLKEVVTMMQMERIGSVVITDAKGHLVGIFTETDALRALSKLL
jgi:CBS domain-containing protein